jgi:integration host factor subunit beta
MNKSELVKKLSKEKKLNQKKAEAIISTVFGSMTDAIINHDRIEIRGFGSFAIKEYGSYHGRNPKTGARVMVHSKKLPFFKVGKELKIRINNR